MQSYLIITPDGHLTLKEVSSLLTIPLTSFVPELNWLSIYADKDSIGISQIKDLIRWLTSLKSNEHGKTVLISQAELMTFEAQNALLKSLEEPGENNRLLLATTNPSSLLETIISRCQVLNLTGTASTPPTLDRQKTNFITTLFTLSPAKAFAEVEKAALTKSSREANQFLLDVIAVLKSNSMNTKQKYNLIHQANIALSLLNQNVNSRIVLETFLLDLPPTH